MPYIFYKLYSKFIADHNTNIATYTQISNMFDSDVKWLNDNLGERGLRWDIGYQALAASEFIFTNQEDLVLFVLSCGDP